MDNLILTRVASALDRALRRAVLEELREDSPHRFRLIFLKDDRPLIVAVGLRPQRPWIGWPARRIPRGAAAPGFFASSCSRAFRGLVLEEVAKPTHDRRVVFRFSDPRSLVAELSSRGPNLIQIDAEGHVVACARRTRPSRERLASGKPYVPAPAPAARLDAFEASAADLDACFGRRVAGGESPARALQRGVFGIGRTTAELVLEESRRAGRSIGSVLEDRVSALGRGELDPVVEAPVPPLQAAERGRLDPESCRILPWEPSRPPGSPSRCFRGPDPAATAGLYYDALELAEEIRNQRETLLSVLDREVRRLRQAEAKVSADAAAFQDPDRFRLWGEALLAGLTYAVRAGDHVLVPDPYDAGGRRIAVPLGPGRSLEQAADDHFRSHRRARRGLEQTRRRAQRVAERRTSLERLQRLHCDVAEPEAIQELAETMRRHGIPVGLEPATRASRAAAGLRRPRLEGVRLFVTSDGASAMVGKTARDNQRMTFKLAGPEDFWFHVLGVAGAHVVVRNSERRTRPPQAVLEEAAAAAAWYSEARRHAAVDVQWTRRKYVRKLRNGPPGAVTLKKFETVRVRPRQPAGLRENA